jgi:putative flavoprotein involved in K+ transport
VPTIIVEKNDRPGDSWRKRYKSLCLHDPVWYDHLPYLKFPENWPVFAPKDKIGDWLEMYTKVMELNYWTAPRPNPRAMTKRPGEWTVVVDRDGKEVVLRPKQLVLATGMSGKCRTCPSSPAWKVQGRPAPFLQAPRPRRLQGQEGVVVGSNNSAHDICAALWETTRRDHGAAVLDPYRASDTLMDVGLGALYSEEAVANGMTTNKADLIFASLPYADAARVQIPLCDEMKKRDKDFYDGLEEGRLLARLGATTTRACS